ncbi:terminase [Gilliamella sp. ESL0250]|uniref:terminase n=1 Tax=Gilliamella sp. ESL0250 TaxID=2705036 RepID=UPI0015812636|nr:terminase [Gilliamella sp. ESL0250]NUF49512.1 terminase [Gilliamella sp. ESL0250]
MARPTNYREEYAEQARKLCLLGYTDKQLADFFNVSEQTINTWKTKHPQFLESIKKGKEIADVDVVESLYKRAIGIEYEEVELKTDGKNKSKRVIKKLIPPDTTAQIFWLKNRQPHKWRDKQEIDHQSSDGSMSSKPTRIELVTPKE